MNKEDLLLNVIGKERDFIKIALSNKISHYVSWMSIYVQIVLNMFVLVSINAHNVTNKDFSHLSFIVIIVDINWNQILVQVNVIYVKTS